MRNHDPKFALSLLGQDRDGGVVAIGLQILEIEAVVRLDPNRELEIGVVGAAPGRAGGRVEPAPKGLWHDLGNRRAGRNRAEQNEEPGPASQCSAPLTTPRSTK